jgi:hypothetical protein
MTPLGHAGISLLAGLTITKLAPNLAPSIVLTATVIGGVALDLDLLYRTYQKGTKVLDSTIGQHRFFPTHTPLFVLILGIIISLINFNWSLFFVFGAFIHLFLDTLFFPEGINFTYPFNRKMTSILTIKTHPFWAPKPISQIDGWWKNYFRSPLFWATEVLPTTIAIVLLFLLI